MSEGFSADWLSLREPYDGRATDRRLLRRLAAWAGSRPELRILDLGAGTGSTLRRLSSLLPGGQRWTLVELDPSLIDVGTRMLAGAPGASYRRLDLQADLEALGEGQAELITASALLDLVSADWLRRLVALRARLGCALYASLTVDGRIDWQPDDPLDAEVRDAVNRHQRVNKGFGPALGAEAAPALHRLLRAAGGSIELAPSSWLLGPGDGPIQSALLAGYLDASSSVEPSRARAFRAWHEGRLRRLDSSGGSMLAVGHLDLLYLPPPATSTRTA